ncbi:MAG: RnfABCDGE type electron transport complex subunit D [Candidatus Marinimicrobia bacterium]|nr:RnfABCDGE type electron transport complex subunit D [Candidatus Neomarinimicrobiota bacterium]MCF7903806.1 RnfABCDGE type electron transport complex subunit D [Candidatus Neomarinimicrobiota bacterium]
MSETASTPEKQPIPKKVQKDPRAKLFKPEISFILASSPHFHASASVPKIMWNVILALVPAVIMAFIYFGWASAGLILSSVSAALLSEMLVNKVKGGGFTILDGSAAITGLLLALTLPPTFSLGGAALGSVFAILIGKHVFGGLGYNIFNPALLGRAFLQASFPVKMTSWSWPLTTQYVDLDGVTAATPLGLFKFEQTTTELTGLLTGNISGSLGETSALAVLAGGLYLLIRKYADWRIPLSYLLSVFLISGIFWLISPEVYPSPVFHLFSGGLMLGAFFMATDMVTSPVTAAGAWIFGAGAGLVLVLIRLFGGLPEGVMYSILFMNAFTPIINRYTRPKFFGEIRA